MEHTQPKHRPLAIWNPVTDRWELEQETIFGHSDAYSETWPTSGMTVNGVAYELPMWEHHTADTGSSSSQYDAMLPTPLANEAEKAWVGKRESKGQKYLSHIIGEHLLPTPNTMDMLPAREGEAMERQLRRGQGENASRRSTMGNLREDILQTVNQDVFKPTGEYTPRLFVDGKPCEEPPLPLQS